MSTADRGHAYHSLGVVDFSGHGRAVDGPSAAQRFVPAVSVAYRDGGLSGEPVGGSYVHELAASKTSSVCGYLEGRATASGGFTTRRRA